MAAAGAWTGGRSRSQAADGETGVSAGRAPYKAVINDTRRPAIDGYRLRRRPGVTTAGSGWENYLIGREYGTQTAGAAERLVPPNMFDGR